MIRLKRYKSAEFEWISPDQIVRVKPNDNGGSYVYTADEYDLPVAESPEEVVRKVLEYRLAMERYREALNAAVSHDSSPAQKALIDQLCQLAGLEAGTE